MDIGLIFRAGEPLDRKHYALGTALVLIVSFATWSIFHTVLIRLPLVLFLLMLAVPVPFLFMFRLRRVVDICFSKLDNGWLINGRFYSGGNFYRKRFSACEITMAVAFELILLLVPTGANIRTTRH